eukprot:365459-Chlamydomonas_euryale.AAC.3
MGASDTLHSRKLSVATLAYKSDRGRATYWLWMHVAHAMRTLPLFCADAMCTCQVPSPVCCIVHPHMPMCRIG